MHLDIVQRVELPTEEVVQDDGRVVRRRGVHPDERGREVSAAGRGEEDVAEVEACATVGVLKGCGDGQLGGGRSIKSAWDEERWED